MIDVTHKGDEGLVSLSGRIVVTRHTYFGRTSDRAPSNAVCAASRWVPWFSSRRLSGQLKASPDG